MYFFTNPNVNALRHQKGWFKPRLSKSESYIRSWEIGRIVNHKIRSWIIRSYLFSDFKEKTIDSDFIC